MKIQTLELNAFQVEKIEEMKIEKIEEKKTFWKRQFQAEATPNQNVFDGIFGIVLPVICFFFDPIVFRGYGAYLGDIKPFAYLLSFVSIMALLAFLLWGGKLKWLNGFLSGLFAIGAIISTGIGLALLPISLIGLVVLIGALGLTPLFTGFVYGRNAVRAFKTAKSLLGTKLLINMTILSAILSFTIPEVLNVKVQKGLKTIETGDVQTINRTAKKLKFFAPFVNLGSIEDAYRRENSDDERKAALASAYKEISGKKEVPGFFD
jgi:hypothetical protein